MRALAYALPLIPSALWAEVPKVAVDIAPVHSIVAAVMDGVGTPDLIVAPGASPHGYSMRPSEARALDQADVVVWIGAGLTPWLDGPIDALSDGATVLTLLETEGTETRPYREGATFEAGHEGHDHGDHDDHGHEDVAAKDDHDHDHDHDHEDVAAKDDDHDHDHDHEEVAVKVDDHDHDHEHGEEKQAVKDDHDHDHDHEEVAAKDDHDHDHGHEEVAAKDDHDDHHDHDHAGGADPHAWLDPHNAEHWAGVIAAQLAAIDPENADLYAANAAKFGEAVEAAEADVAASLASVQDKPFVVFHDAYQYFEGHFGVAAVGAISESDASSPSAARVAEVRDTVADLGAVCALTEPQFNPGIADAIGAAKLGEIDPLGATLEPGPALYPTLLRAMGESLAECLS
ncbi:MAG: zinc ABC transporter substrate-binding protein [Pseudomonadota bacterium]